jgi:hypothetical protein
MTVPALVMVSSPTVRNTVPAGTPVEAALGKPAVTRAERLVLDGRGAPDGRAAEAAGDGRAPDAAPAVPPLPAGAATAVPTGSPGDVMAIQPMADAATTARAAIPATSQVVGTRRCAGRTLPMATQDSDRVKSPRPRTRHLDRMGLS